MRKVFSIGVLLLLVSANSGCGKGKDKTSPKGKFVVNLHYQEADAENAVWVYGLTKVQLITNGEVITTRYGSPSDTVVIFEKMPYNESLKVRASCDLERYYPTLGQTFQSKGLSDLVAASHTDSLTTVSVLVKRVN